LSFSGIKFSSCKNKVTKRIYPFLPPFFGPQLAGVAQAPYNAAHSVIMKFLVFRILPQESRGFGGGLTALIIFYFVLGGLIALTIIESFS
jgi:hypothetical protein